MKKRVLIYLCCLIAGITVCSSSIPGTSSTPVFKTYGVKINVTDMEQAIEFYQKKLGFTLVVKDKSGDETLLSSNDGQKIVLHRVKILLPENEKESRAGLCLQVNDIDQTIRNLKAKGYDVSGIQKRKEGVGYAITIEDPFHNKLSLMHETIVKNKQFPEPQIYNYGFMVSNMNKVQKFYTENFGFLVRSEKYLPYDLPLDHSDKSFAFMLHFREGVEPMRHNSTDGEHIVLLFKTPDLSSAVIHLKKQGVQILQNEPRQSPIIGKYISFYDPFGYLSELVEEK